MFGQLVLRVLFIQLQHVPVTADFGQNGSRRNTGAVGVTLDDSLGRLGQIGRAAVAIHQNIVRRNGQTGHRPLHAVHGSPQDVALVNFLRGDKNDLVAQSAVNLFGEATMAAYTAASRIGTLALMPVETIGSSLSVYASQNHGAGKPQRIRQGVRASLQLSLVVSTVLGVFLLLCGRQMAGLFLTEPSAEILTVVQRFLLITAVPGILAGVMQVYQQVLRGVDKANQALMGGVMQLITKIAVVAVGAWGMRNLDVVWLGWPASFVAGTVIPYFCFQKIAREMETE